MCPSMPYLFLPILASRPRAVSICFACLYLFSLSHPILSKFASFSCCCPANRIVHPPANRNNKSVFRVPFPLSPRHGFTPCSLASLICRAKRSENTCALPIPM
ncbi:hypothetical protein J3E69DRAFT_350828 [Trichoderma sp. SZMC 28015]